MRRQSGRREILSRVLRLVVTAHNVRVGPGLAIDIELIAARLLAR